MCLCGTRRGFVWTSALVSVPANEIREAGDDGNPMGARPDTNAVRGRRCYGREKDGRTAYTRKMQYLCLGVAVSAVYVSVAFGAGRESKGEIGFYFCSLPREADEVRTRRTVARTRARVSLRTYREPSIFPDTTRPAWW